MAKGPLGWSPTLLFDPLDDTYQILPCLNEKSMPPGVVNDDAVYEVPLTKSVNKFENLLVVDPKL